jgi:hypothetical protein
MIGLTPQLISDSASRPDDPLCLRSRGPGFEEPQGHLLLGLPAEEFLF